MNTDNSPILGRQNCDVIIVTEFCFQTLYLASDVFVFGYADFEYLRHHNSRGVVKYCI